jgi:hypothetical protein
MFHPTRLLRKMQSVGDPRKSPGLAKSLSVQCIRRIMLERH